jgi:two-component system invasion response regulator UvrY
MTRVLIVDDHAIVRRGLKELLAEAFPTLQAGEAENSQTAAELLMKQEWDMVLLDINIPGRNGLEVLEECKRLRPRTPVLVVSAFPEEEFAIRSLKLGASGYLNKSLGADEILAAAKKGPGRRQVYHGFAGGKTGSRARQPRTANSA